MCRSVILCLLLCGNVVAPEMTPTYPKWQMSEIEGIKKTTMELFNKRADVQWYQIGIFDKEWESIPFVTRYKILNIDYLSHVKFDVYINESNSKKAEYICSTSKLRGNNSSKPIVESKICSRFK